MTDQTKIALVDDEQDIRETVSEYLEIHGFECVQADSAAAFRKLLEAGTEVDLAVLDITMPGEDGLSLARNLRETADIAIIFLTASDEQVDRVVGLETGGDDYLTKPVDLRELLARIRAVLRRTKKHYLANSPHQTRVKIGNAVLDIDAHKMFDLDGGEIKITSMEYDLLKTFIENPNQVLSRDHLLESAHNRGWEPFDRSIDIRVARLRRKIEPEAERPQFIKTVRGTGYIFVPG